MGLTEMHRRLFGRWQDAVGPRTTATGGLATGRPGRYTLTAPVLRTGKGAVQVCQKALCLQRVA
ncbi:hypothetical protein QFZ49_007563 [Streptomyces turgidiscabies]|uniref:Uncharacterized protein n=1 Tax=Streptomyces turgidiscabies TaxID=85558 RepID=A0ABU0S0T4_9ACTN|nr:hypothetical protein [Streptomyces turgidiscabies]